MRILCFLALLLVLPLGSQAEEELTPEEMEAKLRAVMEAEEAADAEDEAGEEGEEEGDVADDGPRSPPPPVNRFRSRPKRPSGGGRGRPSFSGNSRRSNRGGGGTDRLGKTQGEVQFELVNPPRYYKKKNRPYLNPPKK